MRDTVVRSVMGDIERRSFIASSQAHGAAMLVRWRVLAIERVLLGDRWGMLKALFLPEQTQKAIDTEHARLIEEHNRHVEEAGKVVGKKSDLILPE